MQAPGVGWGGVYALLFQMPMLHSQAWHEKLLIGTMAHLRVQLPWALRQEDREFQDSLGYVARVLTKLTPLCFREYDGKSDLHVGLTNTRGEHFLHFFQPKKAPQHH